MNVERKRVLKGPLAHLHRSLPWVVAIAGASLTAHWFAKLVSGVPDDYPGQILGGFALSSYLALSASAELFKNSTLRGTLRVLSFVTVTLACVIVFSGLRMTPAIIVAFGIFVTGIIITTRSLWRERGLSRAEWKAMPLTHERRRRVCIGVAVINLGAAVFVASITRLGRAPWPVNLMGIVPTLMFVGVAVGFRRLSTRLPR